MLQITKNEAFEMRKVCGADSVKMSHSRYPKYYLVETGRNLKALEKYRKSITN